MPFSPSLSSPIDSLRNATVLPVHRSPSDCSLSSSQATDDSLHRRLVASISSNPPRRPEVQHLAVIVPRACWKSDREETKCNIAHCRKVFGLFDRKHHCRRCGGVFCHDCSAQVTPLLDTSKLGFIYPPQDVLLETLSTPENPMRPSRVCDVCYEMLHGTIPERQKELRHRSISICSSRPPVTRSRTYDGTETPRKSNLTRSASTSKHALQTIPVPPPTDENDRFAGYPLRVPSAICKATGGGRWVPTPQPVRWDYRPFGGKSLYELEMEKSEQRKRERRENPIVIDGEFAVRKYPPSRSRHSVCA